MKPVAILPLVIALVLTLEASDARAQETHNPTWGSGQCFQQEPVPPAWHKQPHVTPELRLWAAPELGYLSGERIDYAGGTLALGFESLFSLSRPRQGSLFYGSAFGGELRVHAFRSIEGAPASSFIATGLAFTGYVVEDGDTRFERLVRLPSIFALITPEAGVAFRQPQPTSLYLRWSAPAALLVHKNIAIEVVPALSLLYRTPTARVEELWQIGLAVSWRHLGQLPIVCLM